MAQTFHFYTYHTATRFHIARELKKRGWEKLEKPPALFSELNLSLNDDVSLHFEYKHLLTDLLQKYRVDFWPLTYTINDQNCSQVLSQMTLNHYMVNQVYQSDIPALKWILKPATLNNGDDIRLFNNVEELKKHFKSSARIGGEQIIQQYITNPALYQGRKFTYRVCSVFSNFAGVYLYKQGYANISSYPFDAEDGFINRKVHVTNYVLDGELSHIEQKLADGLPDFERIYSQMTRIVRRCAELLLKEFPSYLKPGVVKKIEFFGFDFIMDDLGKLWLLEINQTPDCPIDSEHELMESLWFPYWTHIVNDFVLPAVSHIPPQNGYQAFTPIIDKRDSYSKVKDWFSYLKPKS